MHERGHVADKILLVFAILYLCGFAGYEIRDYEVRRGKLECSATLEDGRRLVTSYMTTTGNVRCLYEDPAKFKSG